MPTTQPILKTTADISVSTELPDVAITPVTEVATKIATASQAPCFHCGTLLRGKMISSEGRQFCCLGCQTVYELLSANGLARFYEFGQVAGVRVREQSGVERFKYMDEPEVRRKLVDFSNGRTTSITFRIPAIHCIACVWLLENLFRLKDGIGRSQVNFLRKEVAVTFEDEKIGLSQVAALLTGLGYEPELRLSDLNDAKKSPVSRRLWLQLGVAGFAFGNLMLLSISSYLGLDGFSGPNLNKLFGWLGMLLCLPVLFYSAADYWRAAWQGIKTRQLNIEIPIALGIIALAGESARQVVSGMGLGYFDSLSGLMFFLLCGKLFQQKTYHRLSFDLDYRSFFPLSVAKKIGAKVERVSLSQLAEGDHVLIRNGELIPADSVLISGKATLDYSFVTGEADPVEKVSGDYLYAGGRQMGETIEVCLAKAVSQSYLTSLWNQAAFRKAPKNSIETLTNQYSKRFTKAVIGVALGAAAFWAFKDPSRSALSFISVLIVACPCALALAAPFCLGTAQRILASRGVFLKSAAVLESLSKVDSIVFDKTGTLTSSGTGAISFHGTPLTDDELEMVYGITSHSTHPYAVRICANIASLRTTKKVLSFREITGCGIEGVVDGCEIRLGSVAWFTSQSIRVPMQNRPTGSTVHLQINGKYRGCYSLQSNLRPKAGQLLTSLNGKCELTLLSGDNERQRGFFERLFGAGAKLYFNQTPQSKLAYVEGLQAKGKSVMMVGDGLNDAGALRQSNVGVAVVESVGSFSPASDVIISSDMVSRLEDVLSFSKSAMRTVRLSFLVSSIYNVVGISIAARGMLSPVVCAILMPLSSVTVVLFACLMTRWAGNKILKTDVTDAFQATEVAS